MSDDQRAGGGDEPETGPLPVPVQPIRPVPRSQQQPPEPIVVPPSVAPPAPPPELTDPEQQRQLEQFRQFQQFQQFQAFAQTEEGRRQLAVGGGGPPAEPPRRRPLWQRALTSRPARKLLLTLIVLVVAYLVYQHYFGTQEDNDVHGGAGPGAATEQPGRLPPTPRDAVIQLYKMITYSADPSVAADACTNLFSTAGGAEFARDIGTPTCDAAFATLAKQVQPGDANSYGNPHITDNMVDSNGSTASVSTCALRVPGGPPLGLLLLTRTPGGWQITGHRTEPDCTGASGSNAPTSTDQQPAAASPTPRDAVITLYKLIATGGQDVCSAVFTPAGGNQFAQDLGTLDCAAAVAEVAHQVDPADRNTYAVPKIPDGAIVQNGNTATVSSCALHVRGGPSLGALTLTNAGDGWRISGHRNEPACG